MSTKKIKEDFGSSPSFLSTFIIAGTAVRVVMWELLHFFVLTVMASLESETIKTHGRLFFLSPTLTVVLGQRILRTLSANYAERI
jgi:hypothetical protein